MGVQFRPYEKPEDAASNARPTVISITLASRSSIHSDNDSNDRLSAWHKWRHSNSNTCIRSTMPAASSGMCFRARDTNGSRARASPVRPNLWSAFTRYPSRLADRLNTFVSLTSHHFQIAKHVVTTAAGFSIVNRWQTSRNAALARSIFQEEKPQTQLTNFTPSIETIPAHRAPDICRRHP